MTTRYCLYIQDRTGEALRFAGAKQQEDLAELTAARYVVETGLRAGYLPRPFLAKTIETIPDNHPGLVRMTPRKASTVVTEALK